MLPWQMDAQSDTTCTVVLILWSEFWSIVPSGNVCVASLELNLSSSIWNWNVEQTTSQLSIHSVSNILHDTSAISLSSANFLPLCRWFCHVDDDVYVNVPRLIALLQQYNPVKDHLYLGRWSLSRTSKLEVCGHSGSSFLPSSISTCILNLLQLTPTRIQNFPNLVSLNVYINSFNSDLRLLFRNLPSLHLGQELFIALAFS